MCMDSCLKGRPNICCFGCSTRLGINLIGLLSFAEMGLIGYLFFNELGEGIFDFKLCIWLFIVTVRSLAYINTCCDTISKRRQFMWALIVTTIFEAIMFTVLNVSLFDGSTSEEVIFDILVGWGMAKGVQIFLVEAISILHLGMFAYFISIVYEWY